MTKIALTDASVSYYVRQKPGVGLVSQSGTVGGRIDRGAHHIEIRALEDITLSIAAGEKVGLIGTNGSGKSTLLRLCAGALGTKSGTVDIKGKVTPQFALGSGIRPGLTGRLNAELKCLYLGVPQSTIRARIEEVKELSGLGAYFELPVRLYSAGMRSRLIMSLLRLVRGDILVVDEWIGAADASLNSTSDDLQSELMRSASILLLATHSARLLEEWTSTLIWLDRGRIQDVGEFGPVYGAYKKWLAR